MSVERKASISVHEVLGPYRDPEEAGLQEWSEDQNACRENIFFFNDATSPPSRFHFPMGYP